MSRNFHIISPSGHVSGGYYERSDAEYDLAAISDASGSGRMKIVEASSIESAEAMIPSVFHSASIKCGHCKGVHGSVAEVRECDTYQRSDGAFEAERMVEQIIEERGYWDN